MSSWLQAATEALYYGEYERLWVDIMPIAPIPIPACMLRELGFSERRCRDIEVDPLWQIRFLWLMEAHEQRMFGLSPLGRSLYHPERLQELWERSITDAQYRRKCEADGFRFDLAEMAVRLEAGWVCIGERFVEDFLESETTLGVEMLLPDPPASEGRPAFQEFKLHRPMPASSRECT